MAYAPRGSVSPTEGSRHVPIAVVASLARLRESTRRYHRTALVRLLATLRLWRGLRWRADHVPTIWMDLGDIQWGQGGRFRVGRGAGSKFLMVWNFTSNLMSSTSGGSLSSNDLLPWR